MYRLIYPQKTQLLFTNRVTELEILESWTNRLLQGEGSKIAFIGTRRIGKSTVLYEFIKQNASKKDFIKAYINLQKLVIEPVSFAKSYIGLITKWATDDTDDNFHLYDDPQFCMLQIQKLHSEAGAFLYEFINLLQNRTISLQSILEQALNFPKFLTEKLSKPAIIMIDEFQEMARFNNFKHLPEILGFLRGILQKHHHILYVFAGSYVRLMQNIIEMPGSAFFGQITPYYLTRFGKQDSVQLIKKLFRQLQLGLPDNIVRKIVELTSGHPFYIELLTNAIYEANHLDDISLTQENVEKILLLHLVNERSPLSFHLSYIYEDAIGRVRGSAILHAILKTLAKDAPLTITEIANRLSRKAGLIQSGLTELAQVDLVGRRDKTYFINDSLLRLWIYFKFYHPEGAFSLQDQVIQEGLYERFARIRKKIIRCDIVGC